MGGGRTDIDTNAGQRQSLFVGNMPARSGEARGLLRRLLRRHRCVSRSLMAATETGQYRAIFTFRHGFPNFPARVFPGRGQGSGKGTADERDSSPGWDRVPVLRTNPAKRLSNQADSDRPAVRVSGTVTLSRRLTRT